MTATLKTKLRDWTAGLVIGLPVAMAFVAQPAAAQQPRAVIELFTSQGCSSCPPADELLIELARERDTVAITLPVDYWDYLGWKDTLAQTSFTARQKAYARERGDGRIYTPQVVVNGVTHAVGSDRRGIEKAAAKSHTKAEVLVVPVSITEAAGNYTISLTPPAKPTAQGSVWLVPVTKSRTVSINRGENNGRSVTYGNIARGFVKLGDWRNEAATFAVPAGIATPPDTDGFVVLVHADATEGRPGPVLGAAKSGGL